MTARGLDTLEEARKELGAELAFAMDVTAPLDWDHAVKLMQEKHGRLGFLAKNAGGGIGIKELSAPTVEGPLRQSRKKSSGSDAVCHSIASESAAEAGWLYAS